MKTKYCVISHTHWDREWYLPLEQFKMRLVDLIDNLLDILDEYPDYRFHLDAQTIVLEDYLSVKPNNREKLETHVRSGHILVGPWYVQNDFNLTSGEATIRNLMIGTRIAEKFGRNMMIGYAADQFGLVSQLPQIFRRFGIDNCVFGRGYSFPYAKPLEFYWESPDGSKVLCEHMAFWYNNAQRFSPDPKQSMAILNNVDNCIRPRAMTSNFLLMNGVDHLEAEEDLPPIIDKMNEMLPDDKVMLQDTFPEFIERVKKEIADNNIELDTYYGEMRNGGEGNVLTGTLSSRIYLKQWNVYCQALLEKKLEPLYSFLSTSGAKEYPADYLNYLWKLLIENHPHDSICGCSVDAVHEHMVDRFKRIDEAGGELVRRGCAALADYIDADGLENNQYLISVINTAQVGGAYTLTAEVMFPISENVRNFTLTAPDGTLIPYKVLSHRTKEIRLLSPINLPGGMNVDEYVIKFRLDNLDGMSYKSLVVTACDGEILIDAAKSDNANIMENAFIKAEINTNGTVTLTEKKSGRVYDSILMLEDNIDHGNSYTYGPNNLETIKLSNNVDAQIEVIASDEYSEVRKVTYGFDVSRETAAVIPVEMTLTLDADSPVLGVDIKLDNTADDHRMRLLVPTGLASDYNYAGAPFDCIIRPRKTNPGDERQPNTDYVGIDSDGKGIAIFNSGIFEYENYNDENNTIALTLLRSNDMITGDHASHDTIEKSWLAPGNQCRGEQNYRFAIYAYTGDRFTAEVSARSQAFLCKPYTAFVPVDRNKFSGGRPFVQGSDMPDLYFRAKPHPEVKLPRECAFVKLHGNENNAVVISAYKIAEDGDDQILRMYNTSDKPVTVTVEYYKKIKYAAVVNLNEQFVSVLETNGKMIEAITLSKGEIATISIK